jgi:hypothetical protein
VTGIIAHCERCGIPRTIAKRRDPGLCIACAYDTGHRCQSCGKPRRRHSQHPTLCGTCAREQGHTIALGDGQWIRDGLVWRWETTRDAEPSQPATRRPRGPRVPRPERHLPVDQLAPCGTHSAYCRHKRRGEQIDYDCLEAEREYKAEWMRQKRAQQQRQKEAA